MENEKKFINVKLYGEKLSVVIAPNTNGAKNAIKNLLLNKTVKLISLLLSKEVKLISHYQAIKFKIIFSILFILK